MGRTASARYIASRQAEGEPLHVRLFISYENDDGRGLAIRAKATFEAAGHQAWVWCCDARSGAYTFEEIVDNIEHCERFVYLCTPGSEGSRGQRFERLQALEWDKVVDVITFDRDHVSNVLRHIVARVTTPEEFDATCTSLAQEFSVTPLLGRAAAIKKAGEDSFEPA